MTYDIIIGRDKADTEKYGTKGTVLLGKHYVKMGQVTSLANQIFLDVIRSHVIFVVGKRGGGKCLSGETKVTLATGEIIPIKELEQKTRSIISLGKSLKIEEHLWTHFYRRTTSTLLKVRLRTGKEIELTPEHPLLTVRGWKEVKTLTIGSRIATPRVEPVFGNQHLPEHEVRLIAYLLAEGHLGNHNILFTNSDFVIVEDFERAVKAFDPSLRLVNHGTYGYSITGRKPKHEEISTLRDSNGRFAQGTRIDHRSKIREWLDTIEMYNKKSRQKIIPTPIMTLPKHLLALFLNRMFSCDGSIYKEGEHFWKLSYASSSRHLIDQVAHLLLRFGIVASIRPKWSKRYQSESYELEIRGEFVSVFLQEIGFFGRKTERATQALQESITIRRNPNVDTIPKEGWEDYEPKNWTDIGKSVGCAYPKAMRESMRYAPSRQKLLQIAVGDDSELIQQLATSDIFWDEIISIEQKEGTFDVYDITVPNTHNFVANDVIVHNSYTMGVITEGLADIEPDIKKNLSFILLDTMGIYWTMKYPNHQDELLLKEWGMQGKGMNVVIYTPVMYYEQYKKEGIPTDKPFSVVPWELDGLDWCHAFHIDENTPIGVIIQRVITKLKEEKEKYGLKDVVLALEQDDKAGPEKYAAINRFLDAENWGIFSDEGTPLEELARGGQVTVLDVSCYATLPNGWNIKALMVGLVAEKLFIQRMVARKEEERQAIKLSEHYLSLGDNENNVQDSPMVWLVLDEAHEFLPAIGENAATQPLITILREGRQPGISLILATQQPGKIHLDVMTQSDTVIAHRITAKPDVDALGSLMQSYMREGLNVQLDDLPRVKGAALIFDDTNEKLYPMRVRPRMTWHGGSSPAAYHEKKKLFGG